MFIYFTVKLCILLYIIIKATKRVTIKFAYQDQANLCADGKEVHYIYHVSRA